MNKIILNSIAEALEYSRKNYNRNNIIKSLETEKQIAGKLNRESLKNPVIYVITEKSSLSSPLKEVKVFNTKHKFTKTLSGFDQL